MQKAQCKEVALTPIAGKKSGQGREFWFNLKT
jgi:hypothetical protein